MLNPSDAWFVAEGEQNGRPLLIRGRQELCRLVQNTSHPKLLRIVWEYEVEERSGLPASTVNAKMTDFENLVVPALERDFLCAFFCVIVHDGIKEWAAYTSDVQATCDRLNAVLAGHEAYPVRLTVQDDPEWHEYQDLMRNTAM